MGTMWPRSGSLEFYNGEPAAGALAYFFEAGTSTPLETHQDGNESSAHEHPLEADGDGRWPLVMVPYRSTYKFVLKTAGGTTLFTADNVPNPEPFDETFEVDEDAQLITGDMWFTVRNGTRSGAVRCNGRTIGDASSSGTERANADTSDLFAFLWNNLANGQAAVSTGRGASASADFAAHKTIALPDLRGAGPLGLDDMGNSAAGLLGSAPVVSGGVTTAGSTVGANTHTLTEAQLPGHTHSFSATTAGASNDHIHNVSGTSSGASVGHTHTGTTDSGGAHAHTVSGGTQGGTANFPTGVGGGAQSFPSPATAIVIDSGGAHTHTFTTGGVSADHTHTVNINSAGVSADHTHTVSGTSGSTGSGTAHNSVGRSVLGTWYMKL